MKKILLLVAGLVAGTTLTWGEGLSLDAAVTRALKVNTTYQTALLAVDQAAAAKVDWVNWKGVGVSATEKQAGTGTDVTTGTTTTTLGVTLPLFDQLSASATVDQDKTIGASVTVTPLAHSATAAVNDLAWQKALVAATQAKATVTTSVQKAWLAQASAEASLAAQKKKTSVLETAYSDSKAQLDQGVVTLTEVRTALKEWTDARTVQTTLEKTLIQAKSTLANLLQSTSVTLEPLTTADLQALVTTADQATAATGTPATVKLQSLEVQTQQAKADATWWLDPNLSITGTGSQTAAGKTTWNGAVTLTLTLGSWQGTERSLADRQVDLARQTLTAAQASAQASVAQAQLAVQAANETVESRQVALNQAQDLLKETQLLAKAGKATQIDLEQAQISAEAAENDLFAAWADAYGARLDLQAAQL